MDWNPLDRFIPSIVYNLSILAVVLTVAGILLRRARIRLSDMRISSFTAMTSMLAYIFFIAQLYFLSYVRDYRFEYDAGSWAIRMSYDMPFTLLLVLPVVLLTGFLLRSAQIYRQAADRPVFCSRDTLSRYVAEILDSENFLTALRSTLPKGEEDKKYGLDFIPYMLEAVDKRRLRFMKSSRIFLGLTISLGIIFTSIVLFFGYLFVDEKVVGAPRTLAELQSTSSAMAELLHATIPNYERNEKFQSEVAAQLSQLTLEKTDSKFSAISERVKSAVAIAKQTGDFSRLLTTLKPLSDSLRKTNDGQEPYPRLLGKAVGAFSDFMSTQGALFARLAYEVEGFEKLVDRATIVVEQPENRSAELIKRIALGLIVCTFFLAVLRFVARIFQSRHAEMILAEHDDFTIRKFYVAYKSAGGNATTRKGVILSFMKSSNSVSWSGDIAKDDFSKFDLEPIKNTLKVMAKK